MGQLDNNRSPGGSVARLLVIGFAAALAAVAVAVGGYTFAESPRFCGSCHSMDHPYLTWQQSNHKQFGCTDCHLPNGNIVVKLIAKGESGTRDVYHEALRDYPAAILLGTSSRAIADANCLRCHRSTVENTAMENGGDCTRCHRTVVHGRNLSGGGVKLD